MLANGIATSLCLCASSAISSLVILRWLLRRIHGEHDEGHLQLAVHLRHLRHRLVLRLVAEVAPHRLLRLGRLVVHLQRRLPGVGVDVDGDQFVQLHMPDLCTTLGRMSSEPDRVSPDLPLWIPSESRKAESRLTEYLAWLAREPALRGIRRAVALVGRRPRGLLGIGLALLRCARRAAVARVLASRRMPGALVRRRAAEPRRSMRSAMRPRRGPR